MTSPFDGYEVEKHLRPQAADLAFDLDKALSSIVVQRAKVPDDAFTAKTLGTERLGNGIVISESGLILTIGYLITEAEEGDADHQRRAAMFPPMWLGVDAVTGFGLLHALEPLDLPALAIGDPRKLEGEEDRHRRRRRRSRAHGRRPSDRPGPLRRLLGIPARRGAVHGTGASALERGGADRTLRRPDGGSGPCR